MRESQQSISSWCESTFGPVASVAHGLSVGLDQSAALVRELCDGDDSPAVVDATASVAIVLYRMAGVLRFDLDEAAQAIPGDMPFGKSPLTLAAHIGFGISSTIAARRKTSVGAFWTATAHLAQALVSCRHIAELAGDDFEGALDRVMKRNRSHSWIRDGAGYGTPMLAGDDIDAAAVEIATAIGLDWTLLDDGPAQGDEWDMGAAQNVTRESFRSLARAAVDRAPVSPLLSFVYTNWRGETERRRVRLLGMRRGSTPWHPEPQILLRGYCLDRREEREFAVEGIKEMR